MSVKGVKSVWRDWSRRKFQEIGYLMGAGVREIDWRQESSTVSVLRERSLADSADFFEGMVGDLALHEGTHEMHQWVASRIIPNLPKGLFLEFGFYQGDSSRRFAPAVQTRQESPTLYSFDAFHGLRDTWSSVGSPVGSYALDGLVPQAPPGVELVVGWVEDTLGPFLQENADPIAFVHMDLDVYPPTRFVLELLLERIQPGCVVLFDELHGYPGWRSHEFRALCEAWESVSYFYEALGPEQALIRVHE